LRAVLLCAGKGIRLRPFTFSMAKHLLPVVNKPVVLHIIENLKKSGIEEMAVVVGDNGEQFKKALGDGSDWGVSLTYITQQSPLGIADAVGLCRDYVNDNPFMVVLGDNLITEPMNTVIEHFNNTKADCTLLVSPVDDPKRFGIAVTDGPRLIALVEKPTENIGNLGVVGVYVFNSSVFDAIGSIQPSSRGELEITDAITEMIRRGHRVNYLLNKGWWKDIGKPEDLLDANSHLLSLINGDNKGFLDSQSEITGQVAIGSRSRIINSTIIGPVAIGENVIVADSCIGPNVWVLCRGAKGDTEGPWV
jgi:glucose-1-phosphate thymidylyltransferase